MLRALLEERFKLKAHRENRLHDVYFLEQAKDGHKMKSAPGTESADPDPAQGFEMPRSLRVPGMKTTRLGATPVPFGASIPASLKKLGLTLDKGKGELEMIVVDSVELRPTEN